MTALDIPVLAGTALTTGGLWRFFFGPRHARVAELRAGMQEVHITVKGGYSPDLVRVRAGVPLRLTFDRQETGDCTSRVVFPDFAVSAALPAFAQTVVEFTPEQPGQFGFACGMNMIHGSLLIDPPAGQRADADELDTTDTRPSDPTACTSCVAPAGHTGTAQPGEDTEAAERRAEITDLARRVAIGAILTTPIVVAVMARDLFDAGWVPEALMNHWLQLALIAPVMAYTGWPIHRTGWLTHG